MTGIERQGIQIKDYFKNNKQNQMQKVFPRYYFPRLHQLNGIEIEQGTVKKGYRRIEEFPEKRDINLPGNEDLLPEWNREYDHPYR